MRPIRNPCQRASMTTVRTTAWQSVGLRPCGNATISARQHVNVSTRPHVRVEYKTPAYKWMGVGGGSVICWRLLLPRVFKECILAVLRFLLVLLQGVALFKRHMVTCVLLGHVPPRQIKAMEFPRRVGAVYSQKRQGHSRLSSNWLRFPGLIFSVFPTQMSSACQGYLLKHRVLKACEVLI